jgi:hypothetical protein
MTFRKICALGLCLLPLALSGCELLYNLQPHRLRRLNRVSPPHLDPEFTQAEHTADFRLVSSKKVKPEFIRIDSDRGFQAAAAVEF